MALPPADVVQVFAKRPEQLYTYTTNDKEDRYFIRDLTDAGRELGVAYTYRNGLIRPITAYTIPKRKRKHAENKSERNAY